MTTRFDSEGIPSLIPEKGAATLTAICSRIASQDNLYELLRILGEVSAVHMKASSAVAGIIEDGRLVFRQAYQNGSWISASPSCPKGEYWEILSGQKPRIERDDLLIVPFSGRYGVIGVLEVHGSKEPAHLLHILAAVAGPSVENLLLRQEKRNLRSRSDTLNKLSKAITNKIEFSELLTTISDIMVRCLGTTHCFLYLLSPSGKELVCVAGAGWKLEELHVNLDENSIIAQAIQSRVPVILEDTSLRPDWHCCGELQELNEKSVLALPLIQDGTVLGAMVVSDTLRPHFFSKVDLNTASQLADQAAIAIKNARLFRNEQSKITASERLKAQLEAIIHSVPVGIAVYDCSDCLLLENPVFKQMFGLPPHSDQTGMHLDTIVGLIEDEHLHPDLAPRIHSPRQTAPFEFELVEPQRWYRVSYTPFSSQGKVAGHVVSYCDISRDKGIERRIARTVSERTEELNDANRQLSQAFQDLQRLYHLKVNFLNAVSHDLRTPMAAIVGYAEFLQEEIEGPLGERQHQFVQNIMDGTDQLIRLLDDLLDFARMEVGSFKLACYPVEYGHLIERAVANLNALILEKDLSLEIVQDPDLPNLCADQDRIVQILNNLIANAIKF
ncbi:MAG TPA: GAF domain-containing protein, partial [Chroococcales cyanobacterium]